MESDDDITTDEIADAEIFELWVPGRLVPINYAMGSDGMIYLSGDLHPHGEAAAMSDALAEGVTWVPVGAVNAYYPITWLVSKCDNGVSPERIIIMANLERFIRSRG